MSTRDGPSLSEREQAIFDGLAAKAAADNPLLAAALGRRRRSWSAAFASIPALPPWLAHWGVGAALSVVGLVVVILSLSAGSLGGMLAGTGGAVLMFFGTFRVAVAAPWSPARPRSSEAPPAS